MKNDEKTHNLIVCTLCSCYPAAVLGLSPDWYKSTYYRCVSRIATTIPFTPSRTMAVRSPRLLLQRFGLCIPAATRVVTHDSTAEMRYMVLPMRPEVLFTVLTMLLLTHPPHPIINSPIRL